MRASPRRLSGLLGFTVVPVSLAATALLVSVSSYAVFNGTTGNAGNSWSTGSVQLTDDDTGSAMFTAAGLKPGSAGSKCIAVTSTGTLPSTVKLYATSYSATNGLGSYIDVTITQGTGGGFSSCSGFVPLGTGSSVYNGTLATLGGANTTFGSGLPTANAWTPSGSGSETRVFKIDYSVNQTIPNTSQNSTASMNFTWEAQGT